ncbi:hypothetical protein EVAR_40807_1 [Eumeta japonica]|uniref:Uncharacterized protein n=1 Tax=Eumeta variegata TaxID=151549 RepID=A0A4C1X6Q3_EUMVA|nr:hypothetical protein EVAR_40807_1 [Eumeta japonica]
MDPRPDQVLQIIADKPKLIYYNPRYFSSTNITSRRYSRGDVYYLDINFELKEPIGNNVSSVFVLYEYRDHTYRQTFLELGFRFCDLLLKNKLFGKPLRKAGIRNCPMAPGAYNLVNMTAAMEDVPDAWAVYPKGRVYVNLTMVESRELIFSSSVDYELKKVILTELMETFQLRSLSSQNSIDEMLNPHKYSPSGARRPPMMIKLRAIFSKQYNPMTILNKMW